VNTLRTAILSLALALPFVLAGAAHARGDVLVLDIVSRRDGVSVKDATAYNGALALVARKHGGVRVSTFHESSVVGSPGGRLVGLWRFPRESAVHEFLADPNYRLIVKLRERSFDQIGSSSFELVSDRGVE
jgi:hypothetical protein